MKCLKFFASYPSRATIIKIKPFFDVHWGNRFCDERAFKAYLNDADEHTYFLGGGDLLDLILVKDIKRYRKTIDKYPDKDAIIDAAIDELFDVLKPYRDKIIGLGSGNHEDTITKWCGTDCVQRLCDRLSTDKHPIHNLGYSWLLTLCVKRKTGTTKSGAGANIVIRGHHGWGGGSRTPGADLTKFSRDMGHWDADIFLYGHVHKKQHDEIPRLAVMGDKLIEKPKLMCICGTYLKTYSDGPYPTYSEAKGYPPAEIGGLTINIKETKKGYKWWVG